MKRRPAFSSDPETWGAAEFLRLFPAHASMDEIVATDVGVDPDGVVSGVYRHRSVGNAM